MKLLYPIGLLALLAIPVVILVYIIKNRYTEKVIPSTYIWNLSEKFIKRRVPISKLAGIISLILQILAIVFIALAITQPTVIVPGSAYSYCFVLDASGSMNFEQGGDTRFELAKGYVANVIDDSQNGSDYTLIYCGSTTQFVFEELKDKKMAKQLLRELDVSYVSMEETDALTSAQEYFDYNPSVLTYLITDKDYLYNDNITVVDVSTVVENSAISNIAYELEGSQIKITGTATCYSADKELTVNLYFDGESEVYATQKVTAGIAGVDFEFLCNKSGFGYFRVALADKDALPLDNEVVVYDIAYQNITDILLVSDSPFFLRAALASVGVNKVDFITTDEYVNNTGYGLYIFDCFMPDALPEDGAVWFINPDKTLAGTNFSFQGQVEARSAAVYSTSTNTNVRNLLNGIVDATDNVNANKSFHLKSYVKCRANGSFHELIYCDNNPIVFAGSNVYGNREAIIGFDLHDSAPFALSGDLSLLVKNLINYSFPTVITDTTYYCGDYVEINVISGCNNIRIETPNGNVVYPDASVDISEYQLTEVGVYNIVLVMNDKTERVVNVFAQLPEEERSPLELGEAFSLVGIAENNHADGWLEMLLYIVIILAAVAVADYGLYCYEQYQLR